MKIIDPLTNPTEHGGNASDAFDVVIPSMPGYGFSARPITTGWDPAPLREFGPHPPANVFVAPNFAIGAVLMMRFAVEA